MSESITQTPFPSPQPNASPSPPPTTLASGTTPRTALLIVFLVVFIDLLGFGIVLPLLPRYGEGYVGTVLRFWQGADPTGPVRESRLGGTVLGLLMAAFSAMQFFFAPAWGRLSDRTGRRPVLLVGLAGSVVFYLLFGYASDLPTEPYSTAALALTLLFVSRIGAGIAGATIATAQAVIADCTTPERRKHGMALIGAAFGIGFTFGPLVGFASLQLLPQHHGVIGYTAAGLSAVALLLGVVLLPETRRFGTGISGLRRWVFDWRTTREVLATRALAPIVLVFFLATLGFGGFEPTLALLVKDALGWGEKESFLIFAYVGAVLVFTQGFIYRRLANRLSELTFMGSGITLMGLGLILLGAVSWMATNHAATEQQVLGYMLLSLALAVIGFAFLTPSAQALISRRSDPARQGEILGVNQSAASLARILGPIFGLSLYKLTDDHLLPYTFGAGLLLVMLPLLPLIRRGGHA
jgi:MFS family permease